ncbi:GNAT family N-acetyltransferase [Marinifilum caeruleilacunae]|uniref:GNAT family N-acetyltransferase n=1 Tax=Marinifilum caeruleilacunae TaxID=2499076 RepID=A0ABX1WUA5_9BACT|nr:GNAT family N-acetyltransferase [Marinifilum caeruleilacunae]NOU59684.1 GNAT family N-acetyltransferase [Marinifilum caeruleilacunae]
MVFKIVKDTELALKIHQKLLGEESWPEFMQNDSIVEKYWSSLYENFSDYQFALFDGEKIVGIGNMIPLQWINSLNNLPDNGLDWAMEKANVDFDEKKDVNLLVAVQILINKEYRGKGISSEMIQAMMDIGKQNNIENIALPIRPTLKYKYPLMSMDKYIRWKREDGKAFDPWLRVHLELGGSIVGVCNKSMEIRGTIKDWENWSGLHFKNSGNYIVNQALSPVYMCLERNVGVYIEPNVWLIHHLI